MNLLIKISLVIITFLWLLGSILPLLPISDSVVIFPFLKIFYAPVCHQSSSKLICGNFGCTFLCARCVGIYSGVFFTSFIVLIKGIIPTANIKFLFVLTVPLITDVILISSGIYTYSKIRAYSTGVIFGSAAFYYFYIGIQNWLIKNRIK